MNIEWPTVTSVWGTVQSAIGSFVSSVFPIAMMVGVLSLIMCGIVMVFADDEATFASAKRWLINICLGVGILAIFELLLTGSAGNVFNWIY